MMDNRKLPDAKSYGQFCGLARALDVVGERWTMLVVRELLAGPMRFNELKASLGGIASNLLADRLRRLEANRLVERRLADAGAVYALTSRGAELREAMEALGRWGAPLLATGQGSDAFRPRWLVLALPALLRGVTCARPVSVGFDVDGYLIRLDVDDAGPSAAGQPVDPPSTVLSASADVVVALAARAMSVDDACRAGALFGDRGPLDAVFSTATPPRPPA